MKTLLVSLYPPNKYGGRVGGVVILLNDILSVATNPVDLIVYKDNEGKFDLPDAVNFVPWNKLASKREKKERMFKYSLYNDYKSYEIDIKEYDKVIFYPYFSSLFKYKNVHAKFYTIGMDSGPLLYLRAMLYNSRIKYKIFSLYNFIQAIKIDRHAVELSEKVFTVGERDAEFYRSVLMADAVFVHHPVSKLIDKYMHKEWAGKTEIKICFPGGLSPFYAPNMVDKILSLLLNNCDKYIGKISIEYLGRMPSKYTEGILDKLSKEGIHVNIQEFVDDFEYYISNQDVVILPLEVGVGTKNKALTTLGMGVDLIGSRIALENVYGIKPENCAENELDYLALIDLRLKEKHLFRLTNEEIVEFKNYHSVEQWKNNFWEIIYERS